MAKSNFDPNSPLAQAQVTGEGTWPTPDSMSGGDADRTDYPESSYKVPAGQDGWAGGGSNDDTIVADADDAEGPAEVTWPTPDYALPAPSVPDDGVGPYDVPGGLTPADYAAAPTSDGPVSVPKPIPGSYVGHVDLSDDAGNDNLLGAGNFSMGRGTDV